MIRALNILILFVLVILVLSVLPHFGIFFVVPLLPLFFIIPLTYFQKGVEPVLLSALVGAVLDLFTGYPFGFFLSLFLLVSLLVRLFFQEGMHRLSFWHYLMILGFSMLAFYAAQVIYFLVVRASLSWGIIKSIVFGLASNLIYGILFYVFANWYFEKTVDIGNYLKRR